MTYSKYLNILKPLSWESQKWKWNKETLPRPPKKKGVGGNSLPADLPYKKYRRKFLRLIARDPRHSLEYTHTHTQKKQWLNVNIIYISSFFSWPFKKLLYKTIFTKLYCWSCKIQQCNIFNNNCKKGCEWEKRVQICHQSLKSTGTNKTRNGKFES